jgi:hypothetical protein
MSATIQSDLPNASDAGGSLDRPGSVSAQVCYLLDTVKQLLSAEPDSPTDRYWLDKVPDWWESHRRQTPPNTERSESAPTTKSV